jgi:hypothetical protein
MLSSGRRWAPADFPRTTPEVARAFWAPRDLGLLDIRSFRRVDVIQASGVGGGSLVYLNVNWRPRPAVFEDPRFATACAVLVGCYGYNQYRFNVAHSDRASGMRQADREIRT